ncbi:MAG: 30S ribosome-binding factor RbfA [Verrucomicrobium sp.]|nr:30S ribosome-binding factor RbfA [Verrucomicrobium sp.]
MSERTDRMSEVIRRELSTLIQREASLEGQIVTIASVETSPDLKHAYVYVSAIEQEMGKGQILAAMNKARAAWQSALGHRIGAKFTPKLHFHFDEAQARGDRVMELMQEIERQKEAEQAIHPDEEKQG